MKGRIEPRAEGGIDLPTWQAQGDDAIERSWEVARTLGLPLARLAHLQPDPKAIALIGPDMARQLRAVPLRALGGVIAVAMEDPGVPNWLDPCGHRTRAPIRCRACSTSSAATA